jgi:hypothetical protein
MRSYDPGDEHNKVIVELEESLEEFLKYPMLTHQKNMNKAALFVLIGLELNTIGELDKKSGNLFMHIPEFTPEIFRAIKNHQQITSLIIQNEEKRLGKNQLTLYDEDFARNQQMQPINLKDQDLGAEEKSKKGEYEEKNQRNQKRKLPKEAIASLAVAAGATEAVIRERNAQKRYKEFLKREALKAINDMNKQKISLESLIKRNEFIKGIEAQDSLGLITQAEDNIKIFNPQKELKDINKRIKALEDFLLKLK